jgi:hypothetical protein
MNRHGLTQIELELRHTEALKLRSAGATYREIAAALGYADGSAARKAVYSALDDVRAEPAAEVRILEAARLDKMLQSRWDKALAGDNKAMEIVLSLMERRAKLLGLDAPAKFAPTNPAGNQQFTGRLEDMSDDELLRIIASGRSGGVLEALPGALERPEIHPLHLPDSPG